MKYIQEEKKVNIRKHETIHKSNLLENVLIAWNWTLGITCKRQVVSVLRFVLHLKEKQIASERKL